MTSLARRRQPRTSARTWVIARTDLRQLNQSPDFWVPLVAIAAFFFVVMPASLLYVMTRLENNDLVQKISGTLALLPASARTAIGSRAPNASGAVRVSYALAVYLFAPLAVIVPMMISTAVGANSVVGEREKGTGEFLAHSPATEREIYMGKLIASLSAGYVTTLIGFAAYSVVVNVIVGPNVGGWFFPTAQWWILMLWVVPPFLAITLSVVLRLSARVTSAAAAQQASGLVTLPVIGLSYAQATGTLFRPGSGEIVAGGFAWVLAAAAIWWGARAVTRTRLLGVEGA